MATITNKTAQPLSIPLRGGKTLHLGPKKSAEVAANAADHPRVQKLVEAGTIEVFGTDQKSKSVSSGGTGGRASGPRGHNAGIRKAGDR